VSDVAPTQPPTAAPEDLTARYASLLASGERVILLRQRHWLTFLEAGRWFVLAFGCGLLLLILGQQFDDDGVSGYLVWRVERYIVTTRRVIETGGLINKYTRDTTLSMITDMIVGHPWLGRMVGYGEIDLLTGSEQGTSKIRFLPDADGFKKALLDAKYEHEMEVGGGRVLQEVAAAVPHAPEPAPPASPGALTAEEVDVSLSRLADMRDRGLITQAEFDEKKKQLLDRL